MYRIRKATHHRTGDAWCIYPMYDWAHGQSDSIEGVTHSICTLEYEDHRPLYDWYLDQLGIHHPQQIEFARLNLSHTVTSKRKLLELVQQQARVRLGRPAHAHARRPAPARLHARGDPRLRRARRRRQGGQRRGHRAPRALPARGPQPARRAAHGRAAAAAAGDRELSRGAGRGDRGGQQSRRTRGAGTRKVPFSRVLYIEQDDFRDPAPPKYFRLSPGAEVRLRYAYIVKCTGRRRGTAPGR